MEDWIRLGIEATERKDYDAAETYFKKAIAHYEAEANAGDVEAWKMLNDLYGGTFWNHRRIRNRSKASEARQKWCEGRLAQGDESAHADLAAIFEEKKEYSKAIEHHQWVADNADNLEEKSWAEYSLGNIYCDEVADEDAIEKAIVWYIRAAEHKNYDAMMALGNLYYRGDKVKQNNVEAFQWFVKAAKNGAGAPAMTMLSAMYERGQGVEKDLEKAKAIKKAMQNGKNWSSLKFDV